MANDFKTFDGLTDEQIAKHAATLDLGEVAPPDYWAKLMEAVSRNEAVIVKRHFGYAVVHLVSLVDVAVDGVRAMRKRTVLEILFVTSELRGTGAVDEFLAELKQTYNQWPIHLVCYAEWRRKFFVKHGFEVVGEPEPGIFEMDFFAKTA